MNTLNSLNPMSGFSPFPNLNASTPLKNPNQTDNMSQILSSINIANLSQEEQNKLRNINNLQNLIQTTKNQTPIPISSDTRGESNLRRERELTEREKVELEMKKWQKEQKKVKIIN